MPDWRDVSVWERLAATAADADGVVAAAARVQGDAAERPYAEKLLFVGEDQETPFHAHKVKLEDIITRGGGNLMVEFTRAGSFADDDMVRVDGRLVPAYQGPIRIAPGASITIPRGVMHRFYGEEGHGPVFVACTFPMPWQVTRLAA